MLVFVSLPVYKIPTMKPAIQWNGQCCQRRMTKIIVATIFVCCSKDSGSVPHWEGITGRRRSCQQTSVIWIGNTTHKSRMSFDCLVQKFSNYIIVSNTHSLSVHCCCWCCCIVVLVHGVCNSNPTQIGIIAHEFVHTWDFPDLYDPDSFFEGKRSGVYDIMSMQYGPRNNSHSPPNMGAYTKYESGYYTPSKITSDGTYDISESATTNEICIITTNFPSGEYLLIENRQQLGFGRDLTGSGILIWHIDEAANLQSNRGCEFSFKC